MLQACNRLFIWDGCAKAQWLCSKAIIRNKIVSHSFFSSSFLSWQEKVNSRTSLPLVVDNTLAIKKAKTTVVRCVPSGLVCPVRSASSSAPLCRGCTRRAWAARFRAKSHWSSSFPWSAQEDGVESVFSWGLKEAVMPRLKFLKMDTKLNA